MSNLFYCEHCNNIFNNNGALSKHKRIAKYCLIKQGKIEDESKKKQKKIRKKCEQSSKKRIRKKCEHERNKQYCKECGGSSFCEHGRRKQYCKECGGSQFCEHGRVKRQCKECGGSQICEHGRHKNICKECGGSQICEHGLQKQICKECGGSQICEHGRQKQSCKECGGSQICEHERNKQYCKECGGSQICEHGRRKQICKDCGGSAFCEHGLRKERCRDCGGSALCKQDHCEKYASKKYRGHCMTCFMSLFPTETVFRNYKTKEGAVLSHINQCFPELNVVNDRSIGGGCSEKRPDFFIELLTHVIIVEVDENAHMRYAPICENKRMMELSEDVAHRPLVFIRFNPDGNSTGPSCWGVDGSGLAVVKKKRAIEWQERLAALTAAIGFWKVTIPEKTVELIKLFY